MKIKGTRKLFLKQEEAKMPKIGSKSRSLSS